MCFKSALSRRNCRESTALWTDWKSSDAAGRFGSSRCAQFAWNHCQFELQLSLLAMHHQTHPKKLVWTSASSFEHLQT